MRAYTSESFNRDGDPYDSDYEAPPRGRTKSKALPFIGFDDLRVSIQKTWAIKNVIALGETSSWVGGPGKLKSALLTDIAVHTASNRDRRGYRAKGSFGVVYLAFERGDLVKRRLEAYRRKYGFKDLPIAIVTAAVDIMDPDSVGIIVDTIDAVRDRFDVQVGLLVLDTFAKAIALGGGDENSARDQNKALGHMRLVQLNTDVHIAYVGHTGKDEARGARGSNAHLGDVDLMVQFSGDEIRTATITKANDQPEGPLTTFKAESFELGTDDDGDPITIGIVSDDQPTKQDKATGRVLSDRQRNALDGLTEALISFGKPAPTSLQLPAGIQAVDSSKWRDELFTRGVLDKQAPNPRKEFFRIRDALIARHVIGCRDYLVWKVAQ